MLPTRTSDRTFKSAIHSGSAGWASVLSTISRPRKSAAQSLPFYPETARPEKGEWLAGSFFSVEGRNWCLLLPVFRGGDPFTREHARRLAKVGAYLAKIAGLAEKFAAARPRLETSSALERVSSAAIVIDARGRARQMNAPAQDLLGDDFNLIQGRPAAHDPASNRRLQQLVSVALHSERGSAQAFAPIVVDGDEAPWLLVEAMPVTAFGSDLFSPGRVILLLTDLRSPRWPAATQLGCAAFGSTVAEAKLAAKLASGSGIEGAAASLGVSRETARTQLKAVFAKTNTRRQAELAALVARLRH